MARRLRIATAVFFALLAVALIGLWVRSYYTVDTAYGRFGENRQIGWGFNRGIVTVRYADLGRPIHEFKRWHFNSRPIENALADNGWSDITHAGFGYASGMAGVRNYYFPFWLPATISISLAALFAFKKSWRFSLRTILIATTLIAVALGLIVYSF